MEPHQQLVTEDQLMLWLGFKQRSRLVKWLDREGIPYRLGNKGVVVTTINCLEANQLRKAEETAVPKFLNGCKS